MLILLTSEEQITLYFKHSVYQLHVYITYVSESKRRQNPVRKFFHGIIFDTFGSQFLWKRAGFWRGERKPLIDDLGFILWKIVYPREQEARLIRETYQFLFLILSCVRFISERARDNRYFENCDMRIDVFVLQSTGIQTKPDSLCQNWNFHP